MCPWHKTNSLAERYDLGLAYMRNDQLSANVARPLSTAHWPKENIEFLEHYRDWMLSGGTSELVTNLYHVMMAGHVFGLTLKPYKELDPDRDLDCALEYVQAKKLSADWTRNCRNSLKHFRRYLRLERGLGDESKITPFDPRHVANDLPEWLVNELERYQHIMQRNWRTARIEQEIRRFWSVHLRIWRFLCEERGVQKLEDLKRKIVLDYVDHRLAKGLTVSGVNADLRYIHTFLLFLQDEGYAVPKTLLRIPGLKPPDPLPKYLTDEQVRSLREVFEQNVRSARFRNELRIALLDRAAYYLLWQAGMRVGEVEELRLEDLDLGQKRLSVRDGKGRKDRTIYLTENTIHAVQEYLKVRGQGNSEHVFLYRNAPLSKDLIRSRLKTVGTKIGVKVYPHRLRHTCGTQLLNAGCRVTSIQRFLGHKKLGTTMVYARAYDQTVADDYFTAMERVEQRLEIAPVEDSKSEAEQERKYEVVKMQVVFQLIQQLETPELQLEERLGIASQLRGLFGDVQNIHRPKMIKDVVSRRHMLALDRP